MVDAFMPDVVVEIAWDSGYTTPAADRTWTDVSDYVELAEGIGIGVGRQDERSTADANSLTLTFDNSDGRFTAGRAASPYYPNVKIGRPIRVTVTPPGGTTATRFTGFVDEWPVVWDGTDAYAAANIRASSRLSRLGLSAKMRSMPEAAILASRPLAYWTLGDASGSTSAAESSGNGQPNLKVQTSDAATPLVFGSDTGPGTDGLTAAHFGAQTGTPAEYLVTEEIAIPAGTRTIRASVRIVNLASGGAIALDGGLFGVSVDGAGLVTGTVTTGPSINDGLTHDVAVVRDASNEILYLDGVAVSTVPAGALGGRSSLVVGYGPECVVAHVAVYDVALTAAQIADQAETMQASYVERTDERALRILGWAGVAATEVTTETGDESMTYQATSGASVVDALRDVESTEGGVLFDGRDGNVTFHNRSHRYLAEPAVTLNIAAQHVGADYAPKLDRSTLLNDVEVSNPTTDEKARVTDADSADEYGIATGSATSVADSYFALQAKASWLVASYAEPRSRVPSLTVDVLAHQGGLPSAQDLLALTVGDLLAVQNAPMQADVTDTSYFVEGYTETIGPESYSLTFNLSPTHPTLSVLVLDDPVRGLLDTGILAL